MAYPNPTSKWAAAPLLVPKPGPAKFRFTFDLRPVNKYTEAHQFPMPVIEPELTKLDKSCYFATLDLSHGYWRMPLDPSSQSLHSFITPDGIYSSIRVLHGTTNAITHLQSSFSGLLPETLLSRILYWLDAILAHSVTVEDLLDWMRKCFEVCPASNIRLHPSKCVLFAQRIR